MNTTDATAEIERLVAKLCVFSSNSQAFVNVGHWQEIERIGWLNCPAFVAAYRSAQAYRMSEVDKLRLIAAYLALQCLRDRDELLRLLRAGCPVQGSPWIDSEALKKAKG